MQLDFSYGGMEDSFKRVLSSGINLFCGAGFSVLAKDRLGEPLPLGAGMLEELKKRFDVLADYKALPQACDRILRSNRGEFHDYLRERFEVSDFDARYRSLHTVAVRNVYTTNVDDLFYNIYDLENGAPCQLVDRSRRGNVSGSPLLIPYAALHGCIRDGGQADYVFGATQIASAYVKNSRDRSWRELATDAAHSPMLFWGWNFADSDTIAAMFSEGDGMVGNQERWILLRDTDGGAIDYLDSLGFHVVLGDTEGMLDYLSASALSKPVTAACAGGGLRSASGVFKRYLPPTKSAVPPSPLNDFYTESSPQWSHIYSGSVPKTHWYAELANMISSGKNIIVMGMRGSGKTTLMMQLLAELDLPRVKHCMNAPTVEEMKAYIGLLSGKRVTLFIDFAFSDTFAVREALDAANVQAICFDRDSSYETQLYRISSCDYDALDITEISDVDAQKVYDAIPLAIRRRPRGSLLPEDDPSIANMLFGVITWQGGNFLETFQRENPDAAEIFLMICYVHSCGTACSFDMIYSYLSGRGFDWKGMYDLIEEVGTLIKEHFSMEMGYRGEQDYFVCRSRCFAQRLLESIDGPNETYACMLERFVSEVPVFKICRYDIFRRSGYDADKAIHAFGGDVERGRAYYELCAQVDGSEYVYQQAAIYFSRCGERGEAFYWIERAKGLARYNRFSIDSTYARIYFDANIGVDNMQAAEALRLLERCCREDQRKPIHFQTFAKLVLRFAEEAGAYGAEPWLLKARDFVLEGISEEGRSSFGREGMRRLRKYLGEIDRWIREVTR